MTFSESIAYSGENGAVVEICLVGVNPREIKGCLVGGDET